MSDENFENKGVNRTRSLGEGSLPDWCFLVQQREPVFREWRDRGLFKSTKQSVCDQARTIRKNGSSNIN